MDLDEEGSKSECLGLLQCAGSIIYIHQYLKEGLEVHHGILVSYPHTQQTVGYDPVIMGSKPYNSRFSDRQVVLCPKPYE